MKVLIFGLALLISLTSMAALEIPGGMSSFERKKALEILGYSSVAKVLGNPYPLGGYAGIEVGYTVEVISTSELSRLGNKTGSQNETSFSNLTFGKGLYNNVDVFVQFAPLSQSEEISSYGGQLRWGFYQSEFLPAHLTALVFGSSSTFQNKISTVSQGADLLAGFTVQDVTLYTGIGMVRTSGTFIGGAGVTDNGETAQEEVSQSHYVAGLNVKFSKTFLAMEIDRHSQATYSAKLGLRF